MAYCNNDNDAAKLVAHKLGANPDISWDNIDMLVRRTLAQIGYRPMKSKLVVLKVVEILKAEGKFNNYGDPNNVMEASKHRQIMDDHFKRARAYLYGFPTATKDEEKVKDDAGSTTTVMPAVEADVVEDGQIGSVADGKIAYDDEPMEESAPLPMSDALAAEKIADKIMGTPDLTFQKIEQLVNRYLSMVNKTPTDAKYLSVLVFDRLQELELAEDHNGMDASMLGLTAYRNGESHTQCPYDEDFEFEQYAEWMRGWRQGATEAGAPIDLGLNETDEDELDDQAYLDKRVSDYMADVEANAPEKGTFVQYGREYETYVFDDIGAANEFMMENPGWGAIGETPDGKYHIASMDDEGTPIEEASEMVGHDTTGDYYSVPDSEVAEVLFPNNPKLADDFVALSADIMGELEFADDKQAVIDQIIEDANNFLKQHEIWEFQITAVSVADPENFVWRVHHIDEDNVEEGQEAILKIPRDQAKDFEDDVVVGGIGGPHQDLNYIGQLKRLAGLK